MSDINNNLGNNELYSNELTSTDITHGLETLNKGLDTFDKKISQGIDKSSQSITFGKFGTRETVNGVENTYTKRQHTDKSALAQPVKAEVNRAMSGSDMKTGHENVKKYASLTGVNSLTSIAGNLQAKSARSKVKKDYYNQTVDRQTAILLNDTFRNKYSFNVHESMSKQLYEDRKSAGRLDKNEKYIVHEEENYVEAKSITHVGGTGNMQKDIQNNLHLLTTHFEEKGISIGNLSAKEIDKIIEKGKAGNVILNNDEMLLLKQASQMKKANDTLMYSKHHVVGDLTKSWARYGTEGSDINAGYNIMKASAKTGKVTIKASKAVVKGTASGVVSGVNLMNKGVSHIREAHFNKIGDFDKATAIRSHRIQNNKDVARLKSVIKQPTKTVRKWAVGKLKQTKIFGAPFRAATRARIRFIDPVNNLRKELVKRIMQTKLANGLSKTGQVLTAPFKFLGKAGALFKKIAVGAAISLLIPVIISIITIALVETFVNGGTLTSTPSQGNAMQKAVNNIYALQKAYQTNLVSASEDTETGGILDDASEAGIPYTWVLKDLDDDPSHDVVNDDESGAPYEASWGEDTNAKDRRGYNLNYYWGPQAYEYKTDLSFSHQNTHQEYDGDDEYGNAKYRTEVDSEEIATVHFTLIGTAALDGDLSAYTFGNGEYTLETQHISEEYEGEGRFKYSDGSPADDFLHEVPGSRHTVGNTTYYEYELISYVPKESEAYANRDPEKSKYEFQTRYLGCAWSEYYSRGVHINYNIDGRSGAVKKSGQHPTYRIGMFNAEMQLNPGQLADKRMHFLSTLNEEYDYSCKEMYKAMTCILNAVTTGVTDSEGFYTYWGQNLYKNVALMADVDFGTCGFGEIYKYGDDLITYTDAHMGATLKDGVSETSIDEPLSVEEEEGIREINMRAIANCSVIPFECSGKESAHAEFTTGHTAKGLCRVTYLYTGLEDLVNITEVPEDPAQYSGENFVKKVCSEKGYDVEPEISWSNDMLHSEINSVYVIDVGELDASSIGIYGLNDEDNPTYYEWQGWRRKVNYNMDEDYVHNPIQDLYDDYEMSWSNYEELNGLILPDELSFWFLWDETLEYLESGIFLENFEGWDSFDYSNSEILKFMSMSQFDIESACRAAGLNIGYRGMCCFTSYLMVAQYYNKDTMSNLTMNDVLNYARRYVTSQNGYTMSGQMVSDFGFHRTRSSINSSSLSQIRDSINNGQPVIMHIDRNWTAKDELGQTYTVKKTGGSHFMVITGMDKDHVYIADPSASGGTGKLTVTIDEFKSGLIGATDFVQYCTP